MDPITAALNFGEIRAGVTLSVGVASLVIGGIILCRRLW